MPVGEAARKLFAYCERNNWAGYDPYDALNSEILKALPLLNRKSIRLALTQALKRAPVDLRRLLRVPPSQNPKALGLFLRAALKLLRLGVIDDAALPRTLCDTILHLRSPGEKYWAWGYSFPWQTRTILVPRSAPNLVCTVFVSEALLDCYEEAGDTSLLEVVQSAGEYLVNELYYREDNGVASFRYPLPSIQAKVHNANFLAAALLARLFHHTGREDFRNTGLEAARYSASRQRANGSWFYGEAPTQRWIDNFHTGYNLSGLKRVSNYLSTSQFESQIARGFAFYRSHFFANDGAVRYYHNCTYPIDTHCVAEALLTLVEFHDLDPGNLELARRTYSWAMREMWDEQGFFYYRMLRTLKIRIPYMRWSEAWMLLSLATLLEVQNTAQTQAITRSTPVAFV